MCSKITYDSIKPTRVASKNMERRHGGRFNPYYCGLCQGWHTGHTLERNPSPYTIAKRALAKARPNFEPILRKRHLD